MFGLNYLYSLVLPEDKERPEIIQEGRRSKWGSRRALGSPSLTSEPQLHIERLSLKSTWDQQSSYSPSQAVKKDPRRAEEGGREKQSAQDRPSLLGDTEEGEISRAKGSSLENEDFEPCVRHLSRWSDMGKMSPPGWLEHQWGFLRAVKRLRLHS